LDLKKFVAEILFVIRRGEIVQDGLTGSLWLFKHCFVIHRKERGDKVELIINKI
jgi:Zn-finger protein